MLYFLFLGDGEDGITAVNFFQKVNIKYLFIIFSILLKLIIIIY